MANGIGPWTHRCWWQFVDRVARCHTDQMENWLRTAWSSQRERERERDVTAGRRWYSTGVSCWSLHGIAQLVHGSGRLEVLQPARVSVVRVCVIVLCTQPHAQSLINAPAYRLISAAIDVQEIKSCFFVLFYYAAMFRGEWRASNWTRHL